MPVTLTVVVMVVEGDKEMVGVAEEVKQAEGVKVEVAHWVRDLVRVLERVGERDTEGERDKLGDIEWVLDRVRVVDTVRVRDTLPEVERE